ncbi:MAG: carbamoyltransferase N-terminal domain-containing protein, partial [Promethearchaeota archaeon]
MIILGIHDGHDAGACLVENGLITKAVSEERLTRRKHQRGLPNKALAYCLQDNVEVDAVAIAGLGRRLKRQRQLTQAIKDLDLGGKSLLFYEHHLCHQASAFFTSGWNDSTVLSMDSGGDSRCFVFSLAKNSHIHQLGTCSIYDSLGDLYSAITEHIGFKPMDQEGKTMALAALGNPHPVSTALDEIINLNPSKLNFSSNFRFLGSDRRVQLKTWLTKYTREDLAAGIQTKLERDTLSLISQILSITKNSRLCLAGGIFANTVLNQKIRQLEGVEELWIFPAMGDAGVCTGEALAAYAGLSNLND